MILTMDERLIPRRVEEARERQLDSEQYIRRLEQEMQRLQKEAIHDRETALFTSAYFHARLQEEIVRSERYRHFLSLVLVHLELNYSHSTHQLNQELGRLGHEMMTGMTRRSDTVALYRRQQMIIMLPETDGRGAAQLLERYRMTFPSNGRALTFSVVTFPRDASNLEMVLNRLQEASDDLYRRSGSDQAPLPIYHHTIGGSAPGA